MSLHPGQDGPAAAPHGSGSAGWREPYGAVPLQGSFRSNPMGLWLVGDILAWSFLVPPLRITASGRFVVIT
jgi:hypothetical protein